MLVGAITGPGFATAKRQIEKANSLCDAVELRVDLMGMRDKKGLQELLSYAKVKTILTDPDRGAEYACLAPDFLTLTWNEECPSLQEGVKVIREYHNFIETPSDLEAIYQGFKEADIIKMATLATKTTDALRMLLFAREKKHFAGICMGELGISTRILGPLVGNALNFASIERGSALGQLSVEELLETYHFRSLSETTVPYGLIGNPISQSVSHESHNARFRKEKVDAVYIKMCLEAEELSSFFPMVKALGFRGLSVTRPFKEQVQPFASEIEERAEKIGAINTLTFSEKGVQGANTDAEGALDAIEAKMCVAGKKFLLLGTGGAAKAIAFEALARGALLTTLSRDREKAQAFAAQTGGDFGTYEAIPEYDIVVNTAPIEVPFPIENFVPRKVVMDITNRHAESVWMLHAKALGCTLVYGLDMFHRQAIGQFTRWLTPVQIYSTS